MIGTVEATSGVTIFGPHEDAAEGCAETGGDGDG